MSKRQYIKIRKGTPIKHPKVHKKNTKEVKERLKKETRDQQKQHPLKQSPNQSIKSRIEGGPETRNPLAHAHELQRK